MALYVMPPLFALFAWWFSTGLVLYVVGRPRATHVNAMVVTTVLLAAALWVLWSSASDTSLTGAYLAFASALMIWGWHEMSFLLGYVTGPRTTAESKLPSNRAPLSAAIEVIIYHEFAIALTAALIVVMTADAPNQTGLWTFVILWLARLSTKLNIYLGVPNHTEQFLPAHLKYIATYFCRRPMNVLFPLTVTATTLTTAMLIEAAQAETALPHEIAGYAFLATLMALAVLEHWFLVLPIPSAELWTWGLASRELSERQTRTSVTDANDDNTPAWGLTPAPASRDTLQKHAAATGANA